MRDGHVFTQASHGRHLVAVNGVDDATCAQEEQCLEHGVGEQVEHGGHVAKRTYVFVPRSVFCANAERHHHKRNLRDGGEGQYALNVALAASHCGSVESGEGTYPSHNVKCARGILNPQGEEACNLEHTSNHHGGSMDKSRHGGGAFHCIGQPNVQGEHGTLTSTTDEHEEQGGGKHHGSLRKASLVEVEAEGVAVVAVDEDADQEEEVGKTSDDECLLASSDGCRRGVVEANEQIGRHTHQLPEHIHLEDVGGHYQA